MTATSTSAIAYRKMTRGECHIGKIIGIVSASGRAGVTRRQILDALRAMGIQIEYTSVSGRVTDELNKKGKSQLWELNDTRENVTGMRARVLIHVDFRSRQKDLFQ